MSSSLRRPVPLVAGLPSAVTAVAGAARGLGLASLAGAALNVPKFLLLLAVLTPADLDVLAVGLLVTLTFGQIAGEALANHAAVAPRVRRPDAADVLGVALIALLAAGALAPERVMALAGPGLAADGQLGAVRLFCLAGAAMVALWWAAGEAQARLDVRGLAAVASVPNLTVVAALLVPIGPPLERVAAALAGGISLAAVTVLVLSRRSAAAPATPVLPLGGRSALTHLGGLLVLALASQLNLVALRIFGSSLPPGSLSALYVATGAALLPACAVSGALAGVLMPRWARATGAGRLAGERSAAAIAGGACAVLVAPAVALLVIDGGGVLAALGVDPAMREPLLAALPVLLLAAPAASAAWVLRCAMVARGRTAMVSALAVPGAALVPVALAVSPTIEGLAIGYGLSFLPWILLIPLLLSRPVVHRGSSTRDGRLARGAVA